MQSMMTDHSRLLLEILQKHIKELANTETKYERKIKAKICTDKGRFVLTIDFRPIGEWFKEQFEKLKQGYNVRQNPKQRYLKL